MKFHQIMYLSKSLMYSVKFIIVIISLSLFSQTHFLYSQDSLNINLDTCIIYKSIESALKNPEKVFILDLSKEGYKVFPQEILQFENLVSLKLAKNKLSVIPDEIKQLRYLEILALGKNNFSTFPVSITNLPNLKKLYIDQNEITAIPHDINKLQKLEVLDMWSNDLYIVPESISQLAKLKVFDLRVIQMSKDEQERIIKLLPNTKVHFSNTCDCAH